MGKNAEVRFGFVQRCVHTHIYSALHIITYRGSRELGMSDFGHSRGLNLSSNFTYDHAATQEIHRYYATAVRVCVCVCVTKRISLFKVT